ncbi:hypothetical protein NQ315_017470 [Exocentrus adspersus]|uniref:Integrase p58-like C-terminal domain-containing protein n=1 Tax=Exocentrus adspersus TaxID=1586481 RepID=A0AAV8VK22_9CUCU|nr:hypothetical protein NQ315_017470 [Exocentrus adspersus]
MGGTYTIVTRLNDVVYRIQKNPQAKMKIVHIDRLTPPYQELHPNERFVLPLGYVNTPVSTPLNLFRIVRFVP